MKRLLGCLTAASPFGRHLAEVSGRLAEVEDLIEMQNQYDARLGAAQAADSFEHEECRLSGLLSPSGASKMSLITTVTSFSENKVSQRDFSNGNSSGN